MPVPEPRGVPMPEGRYARECAIIAELEQLGSGTNRDLYECLPDWSPGAVDDLTRNLAESGVLERKRIRLGGRAGSAWLLRRAEGVPHRPPEPNVNELTRRRCRRLVLDLLEQRGCVTVTEAAEAVGCSQNRARSHLESLEDEGVVQRVDGSRPITWQRVEQAWWLAS